MQDLHCSVGESLYARGALINRNYFYTDWQRVSLHIRCVLQNAFSWTLNNTTFRMHILCCLVRKEPKLIILFVKVTQCKKLKNTVVDLIYVLNSSQHQLKNFQTRKPFQIHLLNKNFSAKIDDNWFVRFNV